MSNKVELFNNDEGGIQLRVNGQIIEKVVLLQFESPDEDKPMRCHLTFDVSLLRDYRS